MLSLHFCIVLKYPDGGKLFLKIATLMHLTGHGKKPFPHIYNNQIFL